jgi:hypothetical protein
MAAAADVDTVRSQPERIGIRFMLVDNNGIAELALVGASAVVVQGPKQGASGILRAAGAGTSQSGGMVYERAGGKLLRNGIFALLLAVSGAATAADPAGSSRGQTMPADEELDEAVVQGNRLKPTRDPQKIVNWLKLLVGKFRYEGAVEIQMDADRATRQAQGSADCTAIGLAPGVHCEIRVFWPAAHGEGGAEVAGSASSLLPAMIQYGLNPDNVGIRFLLVDNKGLAHYGQGYLVNDTLTTTTPCSDAPGNCQRITRITPGVDGQIVDMQFDIERDFQNAASYRFQLHRQGQAPAGAISGGVR